MPTTSIFVNPANIVPGIVANTIQADGQGTDWTGGVLKIDLTAGSVYNAPMFDNDLVQANFWPVIPEIEYDSWVGVPNDGSNGIAGGAGDLGGGAQNLGGTGVDAASITWICVFCDLPGITRIANISLTDDAIGTWALISAFASGQIQLSGTVLNGVMIPEPGTLVLLSAGGSALLHREKHN